MYKCKYCEKEFEKAYQLAAHISNCRLNPKYTENVEKRKRKKSAKEVMETRIKLNPYKYEKKIRIVNCQNCGKKYEIEVTDKQFDNGKYSKFCCRSCANVRHHSNETKQKISEGVKNSEIFIQNNKHNPIKNGIKTLEELKRKCIVCGNYFTPSYHYNGYVYFINDHRKCCSNECLHQFRINNFKETNKKYNLGGFKEGSVKNYKSGWYDGIHFDSSWELAFYIYNKEHNAKIERCKEVRKYIIDNEEHEFHPDFVINNQIYEVKGIKSKNSEAKQKYNQDIKFLYRNDIKQYLDYVIEKYGKNFIDLYEKKDKVGA